MVALTARRRRAVLSLALGLGIIAIAQATAPPNRPPLYDGVIPIDAYRWLSPPPGEHGGAKSVEASDLVKGGRSPLVAIATPETPPQAQIFVQPGGLTLPPGTTEIRLSITPVAAEGQPSGGHIAGNVYRIKVTNQDDTALSAPPSALGSVVLRGPGAIADATVEQFVNGSWQKLKTDPSGFASTFLAVPVTQFGDFALVVPGSGPSSASAQPAPSQSASAAPSPEATASPTTSPPSPSVDTRTIFLALGAVVAAVLAGVGVWLLTGARGRGPRI